MNEKNQFHGRFDNDSTTSSYRHENDSYAGEWDVLEESNGGFSGDSKIIARMPDLGSCKTIPEITESIKRSPESTVKTVYVIIRKNFVETVHRIQSDRRWNEHAKKIGAALVVLLMLLVLWGGMSFLRSGKDRKNTTETAVSETDTIETPAKTVVKPAAAPAKAAGAIADLVTQPVEIPRETIETTTLVPMASLNEEPAARTKEGPAVSVISSTNPASTQTISSDSPWERPAADGYTPWTMNSPNRLEESDSKPAPTVGEIPGFSTTSTGSPAVPMKPMNNLATTQRSSVGSPTLSDPMRMNGPVPQHYVPTYARTPIPQGAMHDNGMPRQTMPPMTATPQHGAMPTYQTPYQAPYPASGVPQAAPNGYYANQYPPAPAMGTPAPPVNQYAPMPAAPMQTPSYPPSYPMGGMNPAQQTAQQPYYPQPQQNMPVQQGVGTVYSQGNSYRQGTVYSQGNVYRQSALPAATPALY